MKTIEERAYEFYSGDGCPADCKNCEFRTDCSDIDNVQAYIDGAYSEHRILTEWHDLKTEKPEYDKPVLVKLRKDFLPKYIIGIFKPGADFGDDFEDLFREYIEPYRYIRNSDVFGWRYIHE